MDDLFVVIIAGGSGTRFWPASRVSRPKQLLPLGGIDEPLLAATVRRVLPLTQPERVFIATGAHLVDATRAILPELPSENFLAEPAARNTAPCIGWSAHRILRVRPDAVVVVLPADHIIGDEVGFRAALTEAARVAREGRIVTIGLTPTRPETGYGYIEVGAPLSTEPRADGSENQTFSVVRFVEKPPLATAQAYLAGGKHVWNGGMFIFRADRMTEALAKHTPELSAMLTKLDEAADRGDEAAAVEELFPAAPSISIDYAVMEREPGLAVVRGDFGWSDVGSWESAWELSPKDPTNNAAPDHAVLEDASGNLVHDLRTDGRTRVVALLGVHDLVVVETDDALLVMPRHRAQDVRAVVETLKTKGTPHV
jgi:mannose-1-phosphate guanylyltransferase